MDRSGPGSWFFNTAVHCAAHSLAVTTFTIQYSILYLNWTTIIKTIRTVWIAHVIESTTKEFMRLSATHMSYWNPCVLFTAYYAAGFLHSYSAVLLLPKSADDLLQTEDKSRNSSFICLSKRKIPVKYKKTQR